MEAIKEVRSINQISSEYEAHPIQVGIWKKTLIENAEKAFTNKEKQEHKEQQELIDRLSKIIGQRDIEIDWMKKNCTLTHRDRVRLMDKDHLKISIQRQTELWSISRSSIYYEPVVDPEDICAMHAIDEIYTRRPFYGSRRMTHELEDSWQISTCRKRVRRLMRLMGLQAVYPKRSKNTSTSDPSHEKYPYLLKDVASLYSNHVWGTDITYVKLEHGFCYLVALIDWFSRDVISWELSETLDTSFCVTALNRALAMAVPDIHNSDQGSQFTSS